MGRIIVPNKTFNQFVLSGGSGTIDWLPEVDAKWADEVVWQVMVESLTGAPTGWTVKPFFQQIIGTSQGQEEWSLQFAQDPTAATLNAQDHSGLLPDGDWPLFNEGNLTDVPLLIPQARRVRGGFMHRLCVSWTLTAGTAPTIKLTIDGPTLRGG